MEASIPLHAYDLITELDRRYPEVIYDPKTSHEEFLLKSGERRLVLALMRKRDREDQEKRDVQFTESSESD